MKIPWEQVRAFRAERHQLHRRGTDALQVASQLCGLHAQVLSSAELSLWARVEGVTREQFRALLWKDSALVKTWAMRGTLHLLPRSELPLYLGALANYGHFLKDPWLNSIGITREEVDVVLAAVGRALRGESLTREELAAAVSRDTGTKKYGAALLQSWGMLLKPAAYRGLLCFAESQPPRVRFTSPGRVKPLPREPALRELARRYLRAYGPATRGDFASWWGCSARRAQEIFESLDTVRLEDRWLLREDLPELQRARPSGAVRLLPAFDPYVAGAPRTGGLFPLQHKKRIYRNQGWLTPALLVDGHIDGVWRHQRTSKGLTVTVEPFVRLSKAVRAALALEAESLARFLEAPLLRVDLSTAHREAAK